MDPHLHCHLQRRWSQALADARHGPVFMTAADRVQFVLLNVADYERLLERSHALPSRSVAPVLQWPTHPAL
jgi:hypothetical protein